MALSERELQVMLLICKEISPTDISKRLKLSDKTVQNHRTSIKAKTKAKTNIGIYRYALQQGYIKIKLSTLAQAR
jgi:DNA-binding CsgD family transcriptional regulator